MSSRKNSSGTIKQSILILKTGQVYTTTGEGYKMMIAQEKCKCFCLNKTNLQDG